jgi:alkanesulfonate monooxygenase SsuD/methylene tetrahydromethanopterin reductase-like flavin-dependent oxidoreductase (luciferase family)
LKTKIGIYIPVYGGWLRGITEPEEKPTYKYAADTTLKAEEMGLNSIWVADHMLNPL